MIKLIITFKGIDKDMDIEAYFDAEVLYFYKDQFEKLQAVLADPTLSPDANGHVYFSQQRPMVLNAAYAGKAPDIKGYKAPKEKTNPTISDLTIELNSSELAPHKVSLLEIVLAQPPKKPKIRILQDDEEDKPQHNFFVTTMLKLKASTWDRLPTWGKVIVGGLLVIGTLVGLGAIAFGTMGLVAPAALAVALGALHLAGLSFPFAAFVGAIAGGAVATFLFGAVPATTAITAKAVAEPVAPVIMEEKEASCSDKLKALFSCFGSDEEDDSLEAENQKGTCCTFGAKEASKAKAADISCLRKIFSCGGEEQSEEIVITRK